MLNAWNYFILIAIMIINFIRVTFNILCVFSKLRTSTIRIHLFPFYFLIKTREKHERRARKKLVA